MRSALSAPLPKAKLLIERAVAKNRTEIEHSRRSNWQMSTWTECPDVVSYGDRIPLSSCRPSVREESNLGHTTGTRTGTETTQLADSSGESRVYIRTATSLYRPHIVYSLLSVLSYRSNDVTTVHSHSRVTHGQTPDWSGRNPPLSQTR